MSVQLYSHSKSDLEKAVEIILSKAKEFRLPIESSEEKPEVLISQNEAANFLHISIPTIIDWRKHIDLPHYNFNGRFFYSKKELLKYGKDKRN